MNLINEMYVYNPAFSHSSLHRRMEIIFLLYNQSQKVAGSPATFLFSHS